MRVIVYLALEAGHTLLRLHFYLLNPHLVPSAVRQTRVRELMDVLQKTICTLEQHYRPYNLPPRKTVLGDIVTADPIQAVITIGNHLRFLQYHDQLFAWDQFIPAHEHDVRKWLFCGVNAQELKNLLVEVDIYGRLLMANHSAVPTATTGAIRDGAVAIGDSGDFNPDVEERLNRLLALVADIHDRSAVDKLRHILANGGTTDDKLRQLEQQIDRIWALPASVLAEVLGVSDRTVRRTATYRSWQKQREANCRFLHKRYREKPTRSGDSSLCLDDNND